MKPLRLEMEAFGSYLEKETVDFTRLGSQGIFLICGDTAAGKTTIFDGICFALYGKTSSTKDGRSTAMMRSDYAAPEKKTKVSLLFENQGKQYRIERVPTYMREGYKTPVKSEVAFSLPDGRIVTNIAETDQMVVELLGLEFSQFHQVSMLAQGEFRELLTLDTKNRTPVLRSVFQTSIFEAFQKELSNRAFELAGKEEKIRSLLREHIKTLELPVPETDSGQEAETDNRQEAETDNKQEARAEKCCEMDPGKLHELWEIRQAAGKEYSGKKKDHYQITEQQLEETVRNIEELLEADQAQLLAYTDRENALQKQKELLVQKIEQAKSHNENVAAYQNCIRKKEELQKQEEEIRQARKQLEAAGRASVVLAKEEEAKQAVQQLEQCKVQLDQLKQQLQQIIAEENKAKQEYENAMAEDTGALEQQAAKQKNECSRIEQSLSKAKELDHKIPEEVKAAKRLQAAKDGLHAQQELCEALRKDCIHSLAYRLAKQLKDGMPCPICGSLTHPYPAQQPEHYVAEEQVEEQEAKVKAAESHVKKCENSYQEAALFCRQGRAAFAKEYPQLDFTGSQPSAEKFAGYERVLKDYQAVCKKQYQETEGRIREVRERVKNTLSHWQETASKKDTLTGNVQIQTELYAQLEKTTAEKEAELDSAVKEQLFLSLEEAGKSALSEETAGKLAEKIRKYENEIVSNETLLQSVASYEQKTLIDITELLKCAENADEKYAQIRKEKKQPEKRISFNEKVLEKLREYGKQYQKVQQQYSRYLKLAEAANGKSYKFETYILEVYFDRILERANRRLGIIMKNQFELRRGEKSRGSRGLDINVYDYRTGRLRDVRTLSGGEAFVTSLALAFGLSDIVQSKNSGTRIETMFIDEGFGTLDTEVLEQSIQVLEQMAKGNALIGIISHKEELKSRIENKIIVIKKDGKSRIDYVSEH